jgi:dTMP kinase
MSKGVLIAIEGIDGAGKTTQSFMLFDKLCKKGYPVVHLHEPTDGVWGDKIKDLAKNGRHKVKAEEEMEFFYKDRLEDVTKNINPALKKRNIVIMDRYYFSSVAYQGARDIEPNYVESKNEEIAPKPDLLIILDLTPEAGLKRIREKRNGTPNYFERSRYLQKVRRIFLEQFKNRPYTRIIDGDDTRSVHVVAEEIWAVVQPIIAEAEEKKLQ